MWFRAAPALVLILFAGCSGPYSSPAVSAKEETPIAVQTITAKPEGIPEVVSATGELLAEEQATIGGKVPGRVTKLHVDLGSQVRAGQVLAEIEKDDYELRVRQAEALVNQARARLGILDRTDDNVAIEETALVRQAAAALKEARFIFQTTEQLQKEGVMSRIDMEKAQVRFQGAEAAYQAATEEVMQLKAQLNERRTQVALARQNLTDCVIRAPFAGAVTHRIAGLGEYLAVNAPVVTLVRQHPLRLRLEVPERAAAKVRIGQRIDVRLDGGAVTQSGHVVRLSPAIDAQSRSLLVEGEIPNESGALRPGSFAEGAITVDPNASGFAIPRDSVTSFAGVERVYLVRDGVLEDRVVKTGRRLPGDKVEVVSGIDPGMEIVLEASDRMSKGQRVVVR
jgi:multidrug efflux pump subunit AcrA (membrane-fusion protein)